MGKKGHRVAVDCQGSFPPKKEARQMLKEIMGTKKERKELKKKTTGLG